MEAAVRDYNDRSYKLFTDLFKLTGNETFDRYAQIVLTDRECANETDIIWKHLQKVPEEYTQKILEGDRSFFETHRFERERATEGSFVDALREDFHKLSEKNKHAIFVRVQNIFRVAERIRADFFEDLIRVHTI
jgi:hypothetical protein